MDPTQSVILISALDEERHPVLLWPHGDTHRQKRDKEQAEEQTTKIRRDLGEQDARMIRDQVKSSV